jgi:hypothetical protein
MEYEFTLKYKLHITEDAIDDLIEKLEGAGCEDALVGVGRPGVLALKYSREAESPEAAVLGAIEEVSKAIPSAELIEVGSGLYSVRVVA